MPTINAGDLTLLRDKGHVSTIYGSFQVPDTIWSATINGSLAREATAVTFNTGSGSNFSFIQEPMVVWVGTTAGARDVGMYRVRGISSGDGGVTGTLTAAPNHLLTASGNHLTFKLGIPLCPKFPKIGGTASTPIFLKDGNITYTDENENIHPVVIAGEHRADFIDDTLGYWEITSQLASSYAITPSATISSYSATSFPATGVTVSINAGSGVGTIRFATAGQFWVKYSVTDSVGTTQDSWRFYYAHSTDPTDSHFPRTDFTVDSVSGDWEGGGWSASVTPYNDAGLTEILDDHIAILWQKSAYGSTTKQITFLPDNSTSLLVGYVKRESVEQNLEVGISAAEFTINTVESLLKNHFMYSISLEAKQSAPSEWYEYRTALTNTRAAHHIWKWHSTLMEMTDVFGLDDTDLRAYAEIDDGNLYTMADGMLRVKGIRKHVVSDKGGRLHIIPDIQLQTDTERGVVNVVQQLEDKDKSGSVTILREEPSRVALVKVSGFHWDGAYFAVPVDGLCDNAPCPDADPLCASAPTTLPDHSGESIQDFDRQTLRGQTHANELAGRFFARANNEYPEVRVSFHGNYFGVLDFAYGEFWQMSLQASDTAREIIWSNKNLILKNVQALINTTEGTIACTAVFEPEMDGTIGVPGLCQDDYPADTGTVETPEVPAPEAGLALITGTLGTSVYYKPVLNDIWVSRTTDITYDLTQDPFWRQSTGSKSSSNAIIVRGGPAQIFRSTNAGSTWSDITPSGSPPNDATDSPAPTVPDLIFEHIGTSTANQGEYVVLANWLNDSFGSPTIGERRTWLLYTNDNGTSWTWKYIQGGTGSITPSANSIWEVVASNQTNKSLVALNSTCLISTRANAANDISSFLYTRTGTSIAVQDSLSYATGSNLGNAVRLNATEYLIARVEFASGAKVDLGSATICTTLANDDTLAIAGTSTVQTPFVARVDDSTAVVFTNNGASGLWVNVIAISSGVLSLSSSFLIDATTSGTLRGIDMFDDNTGVVYYQNASGGTRNVMKAFTLSPNVVGSEAVVINASINGASNTGDPKVMFLAGGLGAVTWTDTSGNNSLRAFKITGTTISLGAVDTPSYITAGNYDDGVLAQGDSNTFFFHTNNIGNTVNDIRSYDIDISTLALTDNGDEVRWFSGGLATTPYGFLLIDTNLPAVIYDESNIGYIRFFTYSPADDAPPLGNSIHGLGVDIDKVNADKAVLTIVDDTATTLYALTYNIPALTLNNGTILGTNIDFTDTSLRTHFAFPVTDWFNTNTYYIFGNFYNPDDLVTTNHIIKTLDNGATWTSILSSWGGDHVGALYQTFTDKLLLIRNDITGLSSKVYFDFALKSTLPFNSTVNPHGIAVSHNLTLYVTSVQPQAYMVATSPYPYVLYSNLTFNHGVAAAVKAIELL